VLRQNTKRLFREPFETRQGIRQGDVLSTLLVNVVLKVMKVTETQLLAYSDDIDIVTRNQSAVQ
jgi:hypothetical protein